MTHSDTPYGPTEPAPRCEAHGGRHALYLGHCVAVGAQVPRPVHYSRRSWDCGCGARVYGALVVRTQQSYTLDERTGERHACPPALRVQLDEEGLAAALADAFEEVRRRRRPSEAPTREEQAPAPLMRPPVDGPSAMRGVSVWVDDGPA